MSYQLLAQVNQVLQNPSIRQAEQQTVNFYFSNLSFFKAGSVLLTAFFLVSAVVFMLKTGWLQLRVDRVEDVLLKHNTPKRRSIKVWNKIQRHFFAGDDNSLKLALIEADKVLDVLDC